MAKRNSLEDAIKANDSFGEAFKADIEILGYYLAHGVSKVWLRDKKAPKKERDKYCLIAYIQPMEGSRHPIEDAMLNRIRDKILPKTYRGFNVYVEYAGRIIAY